MGMFTWGVLLIAVGLLLTFSSFLGFLPGVPMLVLGIALALLGLVFWFLGLPLRAADAIRRRDRT